MYRRQYDLKPCPFCGGEAYMEHDARAFSPVNEKPIRVAFVRCKMCNARSGRFDRADFSPKSGAEWAAANAWNERA